MALRGILRSFCSKSTWCYAVFWKLKGQRRMVLNLEDGFYECQLPGTCDTTHFRIKEMDKVSSMAKGSYDPEGRIEPTISKMSHTAHFMGEGIVGRVALSGKYQWVFADGEMSRLSGIMSANVDNDPISEEYSSSWNSQFAAGIKTIAIIAVPQGVVQLGSTQIIMESIEWVNHVKSSFGALQNVTETVFPEMDQGRSAYKPKPMTIGLQSVIYGNSSAMKEESNDLRESTVREPTEAFHAIPHRSLVVQASGMGMEEKDLGPDGKALGTVLSASKLDPPHTNQCISLSSQNIKSTHISEVKDIHLEKGCTPASPMVTFRSIPGSETDVILPTCLHKGILLEDCTAVHQSNMGTVVHNEILDMERSFASVSRMGLQQPKLVVTNPVPSLNFEPNASVTASNYNVLQALGAKAAGNSGYFLGSKLEDMSQSSYTSRECHGQSIADPIPHSGSTDENQLVQGRNCERDCSFGIGDELSEALGPGFTQVQEKGVTAYKARPASQMLGRVHGLPEQGIVDVVPNWVSSFMNEEWSFLESRPEPLLDAVVANASSSHHSVSTTTDGIISCKSYSVIDSEISVPNTMKGGSFKRARCDPSSKDCFSEGLVKSLPIISDGDVHIHRKVDPNSMASFTASACYSPLKSILSSWSEGMQSMKSGSTQASQSKKPENLSKAHRKRARPGESTRPRPKDRQQIQDRVRELREIVPNGSKCSIDALLEKTIKHMIFLQNVTRHADNLKKNGELTDDVESGASWAFELNGEETGHPILVKNLNQPRTLLVEMFCEEKSHFLEIADVIRSLGLSILKGVMESRSDKTWARFIVEANRDIHRIEVMMSLMQFLHVNDNSTSSMTAASQLSIPHQSQQTTDSSNSSSAHTQIICGFPQHLLHL